MSETLRGTFFCNKCGTLNTVGAQFCSQCGASTSPTPGAMPTTGSTPPNLGSPYSAPVSYAAVAPGVAAGYGGFWIGGCGHYRRYYFADRGGSRGPDFRWPRDGGNDERSPTCGTCCFGWRRHLHFADFRFVVVRGFHG